jgi:hypothetical protein
MAGRAVQLGGRPEAPVSSAGVVPRVAGRQRVVAIRRVAAVGTGTRAAVRAVAADRLPGAQRGGAMIRGEPRQGARLGRRGVAPAGPEGSDGVDRQGPAAVTDQGDVTGTRTEQPPGREEATDEARPARAADPRVRG